MDFQYPLLLDQLNDDLEISYKMTEIDLSLITDGLKAEREQGITIDVAYRYFSTGNRKYIIADAPGHEQYTRNMVTGASTAQLAIILIDTRKGILTQTKRHTYIAKLLGEVDRPAMVAALLHNPVKKDWAYNTLEDSLCYS